MAGVPFPGGQLFEIHGNKFKLHPVGHLGEAAVLRVAHPMLLFCIGKHTLDLLFSQTVQVTVFRCVPDILSQFHEILKKYPEPAIPVR